MIKGWLVYRQEDLLINKVFAQWLVDYGQEFGLEVELLVLEELQIGIKAGKLAVSDEKGLKDIPKFVINRSRCSLFAYQLEQMGVRVFNNSRVTHLCNHKARTHQFVMPLGIPSVDSVFFNKSYMTLENCQLSYPLVIKSPTGHGGKQVHLAQDACQAKALIASMDEEEIVIQETCDRVGVDVRVFVLGEQILGAICRESQTDFRSNYSLGGQASLYQLSPKQITQVKAITKVLGSDYVGIDFMINQKGEFVFNEIEDAVGSRTLYEYGNIDVAKVYMQYIANTLEVQ